MCVTPLQEHASFVEITLQGTEGSKEKGRKMSKEAITVIKTAVDVGQVMRNAHLTCAC